MGRGGAEGPEGTSQDIADTLLGGTARLFCADSLFRDAVDRLRVGVDGGEVRTFRGSGTALTGELTEVLTGPLESASRIGAISMSPRSMPKK